MAKTDMAEFSLIMREGVKINDAKEALHSLEERIEVIEVIDIINFIGFYCKSPSAVYESLFSTKLVEKDCSFRDWRTGIMVTHRYLTNDSDPTIPESLEDYFKSVGKVGLHMHIC